MPSPFRRESTLFPTWGDRVCAAPTCPAQSSDFHILCCLLLSQGARCVSSALQGLTPLPAQGDKGRAHAPTSVSITLAVTWHHSSATLVTGPPCKQAYLKQTSLRLT